MFWSLICRALFPRVLRSIISRVTAFNCYSVRFEEHPDGQYCFVLTWEGNTLLDICINVEPLGQRVPQSELSSLSRIITSLPSASFPVSIRGVSPSILRVLSDERSDGQRFVYAQEFSADVLLHCYRVAHQEIFGLLEVTTMVDFLMLRLRGALQEPWMEDLPELRRCVVAGKVSFDELRGVVTELISIWETVREYVRYTGTRHIKSESDKVGIVLFQSAICSLAVGCCHHVYLAKYSSYCCYLDAKY